MFSLSIRRSTGMSNDGDETRLYGSGASTNSLNSPPSSPTAAEKLKVQFAASPSAPARGRRTSAIVVVSDSSSPVADGGASSALGLAVPARLRARRTPAPSPMRRGAVSQDADAPRVVGLLGDGRPPKEEGYLGDVSSWDSEDPFSEGDLESGVDSESEEGEGDSVEEHMAEWLAFLEGGPRVSEEEASDGTYFRGLIRAIGV